MSRHKNEEVKTIYNLELNERLVITNKIETGENGAVVEEKVRIEITRVPGGWAYSFDYPGYRFAPIIFVPYHEEFKTK